MNHILSGFVQQTKKEHRGQMRNLRDLLRLKPSAQDWVDSAVLGGAAVVDMIAGGVTDGVLEPGVVEAFQAQYPDAGSFVEKVQELADDPERLQGLLSGVKGKLFETTYVDYLNSGPLPEGYTAELAESATQQGWDVAIVGPDNAVVQQLQLKASESAGYIGEAIESYPEFEVVVPADVFGDLASHPELAGQLIDGGVTLGELESPVTEAMEMAQASTLDVVPELAFAFIGASALVSLARGNKDRDQIFRETRDRAVKTGVAGAAGGLAAWAFGPWVGIPVSIGTRLLMSRREVLDRLSDSARARQVRLQRIEAHLHQTSPDGRVRFLPPAQLNLLARSP